MQNASPKQSKWYYFGPPGFGAVALVLIVLIRMLASLPGMIHNSHLRAQAPIVLVAVALAGFLAGGAYVVLGRPARRLPFVGPYVAGVVTIAAYMGALLAASPYISSEPLVKGSSDLIIFAIITVFFGLLAGHSWFRAKPAGAEPPAV